MRVKTLRYYRMKNQQLKKVEVWVSSSKRLWSADELHITNNREVVYKVKRRGPRKNSATKNTRYDEGIYCRDLALNLGGQ